MDNSEHWSTGKYLAPGFSGGKEAQILTFANFHGVNTSTMVPTSWLRMWSWEKTHSGTRLHSVSIIKIQ